MTTAADRDTPARWVRWLTIFDDGRVVVDRACPAVDSGGVTLRLVINVPREWRSVQGDIVVSPRAGTPTVSVR